MEERNKKEIFMPFIILLGVMVAYFIFFGISTQNEKEKIEKKVAVEETATELSDTRQELEKLYEERGNKGNNRFLQSQVLVVKYNYPFFEDSPKEYCFDDRMDIYLEKLNKLAKKEGEYDFLYNTISDSLIWNYQNHKKELSEEECERFLKIINLAKKRLKTAKPWEEPVKQEKN